MGNHAKTVVVLLPDGRVEPFWIVDNWQVGDDGTLKLFDDASTHAAFAPGDWQGVGTLQLAVGARLVDRDGQQVPPDAWEGFDEQ